MKQGTPPGKYDLQVRVTDRKWNHEVISSVTVNSVYIHDDAVYSSGSVRIAGELINPIMPGLSFRSLSSYVSTYDTFVCHPLVYVLPFEF